MKEKIEQAIDFVITWVDGFDPNWLQERERYKSNIYMDDSMIRYRDLGTLKYLLRSIEKFAPWVRKIFLELNMKKLVSIIVPIYNAEIYLVECLESIIHQTYHNLEILLIDDGSTDNSGKICDEYAQIDNRIKVVHQENGGVSSARNKGLDIAKGEFITFIDSDDFVDKTYIEKLYDHLQTHNSDIVFCAYASYCNEEIKYIHEQFPQDIIVDIKSKEFVDFIYRFFELKNYIFGGVVRVLYKKNLINNLRFNYDIKISEDLLFLLQAMLSVQHISFIQEPMYFYRLNRDSVTQSYKKNYLQGQLNLYYELKKFFNFFDNKKSCRVFQIHNALLCYYVFSNELKFKSADRKKNVQNIRESVLYRYFNLKNGFCIYGLKMKIKFLIVWFLVKTKLV